MTTDELSVVTAEQLVVQLRQLPADTRLEVLAQFCRSCGNDNPCECWRDE